MAAWNKTTLPSFTRISVGAYEPGPGQRVGAGCGPFLPPRTRADRSELGHLSMTTRAAW